MTLSSLRWAIWQLPSAFGGKINSHFPYSNFLYGVASHCQLSIFKILFACSKREREREKRGDKMRWEVIMEKRQIFMRFKFIYEVLRGVLIQVDSLRAYIEFACYILFYETTFLSNGGWEFTLINFNGNLKFKKSVKIKSRKISIHLLKSPVK